MSRRRSGRYNRALTLPGMFFKRALPWLTAVAEITQVLSAPHENIRRQDSLPIESCPGYVTANLTHSQHGLQVCHNGPSIHQITDHYQADLILNGPPCNTYGQDIEKLRLEATFDTEDRIHVKIYDAAEEVYQVPESYFPRPVAQENATASKSEILIQIDAQPFSFAIYRPGGDTIFNTSWSNLIFQSQYVKLRTQLPESPHLYGLGEHTDPFMVCVYQL